MAGTKMSKWMTIKLKHIQSLGKDIHEYDMWHKQVRMLARKPYLQGAESFMSGQPVPGRGMLQGHLYDMVTGGDGRAPLELSSYQDGPLPVVRLTSTTMTTEVDT